VNSDIVNLAGYLLAAFGFGYGCGLLLHTARKIGEFL